jgi:hypothetical protein
MGKLKALYWITSGGCMPGGIERMAVPNVQTALKGT